MSKHAKRESRPTVVQLGNGRTSKSTKPKVVFKTANGTTIFDALKVFRGRKTK